MIEFNQKEIVTKQFNLDFSSAKLSEIKEEKGILNLVFKEENLSEQKLDIWELKITNDQLSQVRREVDIPSVSPEQLKAIHSKEAAKRKETLVVSEPIEEAAEEDKPSKPKGFRPIPSPVIEKLETIEAEPLNWKNKEPEREARRMRSRLDDNRIINLLNFVFKFHAKMIKTNGYSQSHRDKNKNLSHFLKTIVPNSFNLPYSSCQGIYTAKSYYTITSTYRQQWVDLCCYFIEKGYKDNLPGYLVKHYVG
tara:strand:+ start:1424 stop:2176 length:753 start_codon:yes stop_codon:yes gene_type:complete